MPNFRSLYNTTVTYRNGSTVLGAFTRVFNVGGQLRLASNSELENGCVTRRVLPSESAGVLEIQPGDVVTFVANGAIARDAEVYRANNGQVAPSGTSLIGRAVTAATAAGDHLDVFVEPASGAGGSIPSNVMQYQGEYAPETNLPAITDGTGLLGDYYTVTPSPTPQTRDFGSGPINFAVDTGGTLIHNGTVWLYSPSSDGIGTFEDTSLTTGTLATATGARLAEFANNNLTLNDVSNFLVTSATGTSIATSSGDVVLTAEGDVVLTTPGKVDASSAPVHVETIEIGSGANKVTVAKPAALAAPYGVELWDGLPSAGEVSGDANFIRIDDAGKLSVSAVPGGMTDTSITTGSVSPATGARLIQFASNNLTLNDVSNFLVTSATGTSIATSSGDVVLNAEGDVVLTAAGEVNASSVPVHVASIIYDGGANDVTMTSPSALGAAYSVELWDALPSAGDVTGDANFVRIDDAGKLSVSSVPGGVVDTSITTGAIATATGARLIQFASNNLTLNDVSNFLVTSATGTSIATSSGDVVLNAEGDIVLTAAGSVNASTIPVNVASIVYDGGTNDVTMTAPAALGAAYPVELWDALPSAGDVSSNSNFVRIDDAGKLSVSATPAGVDTNITTGAVGTATGARLIQFANNNLTLNNVSNFLVTSATGTSIATSSGDVVLTAEADIVLSPAGFVNASSVPVHAGSFVFNGGANDITMVSPGSLVSPYSVELWDDTPTAGEVSTNSNFVRINDAGKLTFSAVPGGVVDTSITTGSVATATGARLIQFANNNLTLNNVSNFLVTSATGTSIATSSGDVVLNAEGDIVLTAVGEVNASGIPVHAASFIYDGGTNDVTMTAPAALGAAYSIELLDALPSAGDVTSDANFVRINDAGKLSVSAVPASGGGPMYSEVTDLASRPAATSVTAGYVVRVGTNNAQYVSDGTVWILNTAMVTVTESQRQSLSEVPDGYLAFTTDTLRFYMYEAANGWINP